MFDGIDNMLDIDLNIDEDVENADARCFINRD